MKCAVTIAETLSIIIHAENPAISCCTKTA